MKQISSFVTGSRRGYIKVAHRLVESEPLPIPEDMQRFSGNKKKALAYLKEKGANYYAVAHSQGVPSKGYSNQYCYSIYYGYAE